ncbi:MAG: hypothetical protein LW707_02915 [Sphingobacteriales bacterium]|nr:hypothetical protein [Sphingobacteriales bacterium]
MVDPVTGFVEGAGLAGNGLVTDLSLTADGFTSAVSLILDVLFEEAGFIAPDFKGVFLDLTTGADLTTAFLTTTGLFATTLFVVLAFFTVDVLDLAEEPFVAGF